MKQKFNTFLFCFVTETYRCLGVVAVASDAIQAPPEFSDRSPVSHKMAFQPQVEVLNLKKTWTLILTRINSVDPPLTTVPSDQHF